MILPILISVSLAPGSYFFCAWAVLATIAATANAVRTTRFCIRPGIVFSPFFQSCCRQVSQVASTLASLCLFRMTKQHCCLTAIVIDAGSRHYHACKAMCSRRCVQGPEVGQVETRHTNWPATSEARSRRLPFRALAGGENDGACGISPARFGIRRCADC